MDSKGIHASGQCIVFSTIFSLKQGFINWQTLDEKMDLLTFCELSKCSANLVL